MTSNSPTSAVDPRRWIALIIICATQLLIVLDATIVNIALPSMQSDLDMSDGDRQWVITAYMLAFGSLMLLGGRIADYFGTKRVLIIGMLGFAAASAVGGAAQSFEMLIIARAGQGVFGAMLAPAALSLLSVLFTDPKERTTAMGIFGAIAGGGASVGLLVGGVLTEYTSWRWTLYVNVPVAIAASIGTVLAVHVHQELVRKRLDVVGTVLVTAGLAGVVYGLGKAESAGWSSGEVLLPLIVGIALVGAFALVESRVANPLLPLRVVWDRARGSANLVAAFGMVGMFGMFLFFTYQMQVVMHYSPVKTGLGFLPMTGAMIVVASIVVPQLLARLAPRLVVVPGILLTALALVVAMQLDAESSYASVLLPAMLIAGVGAGLTFGGIMNLVTHGARVEDMGVASAVFNAGAQIGGALGTALLNTIAASATADYVAAHQPATPAIQLDGLVDGFVQAFIWAAIIVGALAAIIALLMNTPRILGDVDSEEGVPAHVI